MFKIFINKQSSSGIFTFIPQRIQNCYIFENMTDFLPGLYIP